MSDGTPAFDEALSTHEVGMCKVMLCTLCVRSTGFALTEPGWYWYYKSVFPGGFEICSLSYGPYKTQRRAFSAACENAIMQGFDV